MLTELPRNSGIDESFTVNHIKRKKIVDFWHYHSQIEIIYIIKSKGTKFVGDAIEPFQPDELMILGSDLPHRWIYDEDYSENGYLETEAISIHFSPDCFGRSFFDIPELTAIKNLLKEAAVGLILMGVTTSIKNQIQKLDQSEGTERFLLLMNILDKMSKHKQKRQLCSHSFVSNYTSQRNTKIDKIYDYVLSNFTQEIDLETAAEIVSMDSSAFSRYFKKCMGKTFIQFVNEVRIGYACKLIKEGIEQSISQIAYACGFQNISNFNKQFKKLKDIAPSEYIRLVT